MALPIAVDQPGDGGGGTTPPSGGTPAAPHPSTQPDAKIALQVSSTNVTITSTQIAAAGGPWPSFKVRVTPLNDSGIGAPQTVEVAVETGT